jgi:7-cyano-7-deazaguanine synthase
MDAMSGAIRLGTNENIEVLRPFIRLSRTQIVQRGHALKADLANTWSCYKGGQNHCGTCGACVERRQAFTLATIPDPTHYDGQPAC